MKDKSADLSSDAREDATGLTGTLHLKKDALVMLTANVDVQRGLANGQIGVISDLFDDGVEFSYDRHGVMMKERIHFVKRAVYLEGTDTILFEREQLPLLLAWARTYHRMQSLTVTGCIEAHFPTISITYTLKRALLYVLLSRARKLEQIRIKNLPKAERLTAILNSGNEERHELYAHYQERNIL